MEPFIGQIIMFGGNFAPRGWALCDGQLLSIAQNTALFSILGTTYGGDGRTTFGLPELRGRVAVHPGNGPGLPPVSLGQKAGSPTTTLNTNNLPPHTHNVTVTNNLSVAVSPGDADEDSPVGTFLAGGVDAYSGSPGALMGAGSVGGTLGVAAQNTGNGTSFNNMQPYTAVNYIIALQGIFPSRN
ncbi:phage tail protein [Stieleria varia]|uniref:Phage Tail Collar Domain protein n=1 Tax=Stieleria varia TaxID=2528005 RepID=A0A5C6BAU7_9BACT|nr:tail fiber protein [Stieleria varia]TWU08399.1 Phage Tail Collar Domain protein [Stieleria varia]